MASHKDRIDDDLRAEGLASDSNTMVDKTDNEAEKTDIDAENTDFEEKEIEYGNSSGNAGAVLPEDTLSPEDYPKGLQFFFILIALILSIFMVALDLVGSYLPLLLSSDTIVQVLI